MWSKGQHRLWSQTNGPDPVRHLPPLGLVRSFSLWASGSSSANTFPLDHCREAQGTAFNSSLDLGLPTGHTIPSVTGDYPFSPTTAICACNHRPWFTAVKQAQSCQ